LRGHGAGSLAGAGYSAAPISTTGDHHRTISTLPAAALFRPGLRLMFAFNVEAERAFRAAGRSTPHCDVPLGSRHGAGATHFPATPGAWRPLPRGGGAAARRVGFAGRTRLIRAVAQRYSDPPPATPRQAASAYDAMRAVTRRTERVDVAYLARRCSTSIRGIFTRPAATLGEET
jgi:hypothetical protein